MKAISQVINFLINSYLLYVAITFRSDCTIICYDMVLIQTRSCGSKAYFKYEAVKITT